MGVTQLDPPIPVEVLGKGRGFCLGWIDYSQEHDLLWIVADDTTREVWCVPNAEIRMQTNWSLGRRHKKDPPAETSGSS